MSPKPIALFYEHPDWFKPLFAELDKRGTAYVRVDARKHLYDPSQTEAEYSVFFNRMSPSAYLRSDNPGIFYTLGLLAHLESLGVVVVNGRQAFQMETSKALQLTLLQSLGLPYPRSRVIHHPQSAVDAADGLRFPVVVKANIGGSGAGIVRYETPADLRRAMDTGEIALGADSTALVQEFVPARDGHITRVETLGGKFLYAINVYTNGDSFNLCPADICQTTDGVSLARAACAVDAPQSGMRVEGCTPPASVIDAVERIMEVSGIDIGGIEYMVDDRDGQIVYYDINALSNFVADAPRVVGFDPFARLADYLETAQQEQEMAPLAPQIWGEDALQTGQRFAPAHENQGEPANANDTSSPAPCSARLRAKGQTRGAGGASSQPWPGAPQSFAGGGQ